MTRNHKAPTAARAPALALFVALLGGSLAACGGGSTASATANPASATDGDTATTTSAPIVATAASSAASAATTSAALDAELANSSVTPTFHMAPAMPAEPSMVDVGGTNASGHQAPRTFDIDPSVADLPTRGLTPQSLAQHMNDGARTRIASASASTTPATTARVLTGAVYTPAQIRAAYGLPDLPAVGAAISATVAATLGRGQTIYVIDAHHDASALADLNGFSTRFGLPTCTAVPIATTATLPLAAAPANCTLSVVYATSAKTMTTTAPTYDASWAPESKIDIQWAHAIAPLARIVLIETPDSMTNNLLGGIGLANRMGAGAVSMSFGLNDPGWAANEDSVFTTTGMTYLAATGDTGGVVQWPAVSPNVLAVGGTGMNWSGSGTRYEQAWLHGGGGVSLYEAVPTWQVGLVPHGGAALAKRAQADVAFNANPVTGQYISMTLPGAATVWPAYGGTSIAAPQWAGIIAVANAIRAANAKTALGDIHALLYKTIAPVPGTYAAAFSDIVDGTNGTCALCSAGTGFDTATGWGTPNVAALLPLLTGVASTASTPTATPVAIPTVPGGALVGRNATVFGKSLAITATFGATTYTMTGAPAGTTIDAYGVLRWTAPVTGNYTFVVKATTSGGSASATYTLKIIPNVPTVFTGSAALTATHGVAFTSTITATDPNTGVMTYTMTGAPAGMTLVPGSGVLSWKAPVAGTYTFVVTAADNYGLSSTRTYTLTVH